MLSSQFLLSTVVLLQALFPEAPSCFLWFGLVCCCCCIILAIIFSSINYFRLIFMYGVNSGSRFIFWHNDIYVLWCNLLKNILSLLNNLNTCFKKSVYICRYSILVYKSIYQLLDQYQYFDKFSFIINVLKSSWVNFLTLFLLKKSKAILGLGLVN
jgi:hypothetical protein